MNYADEGTRFLDEANEAERAASWRSDILEGIARKSVTARFDNVTKKDLEQLVANEHRRLKENDHEDYKKHVGTNQWMLQKAMANFLAALVHNHEPSSKE